MNYLNAVRFHFAGQFRADVSTVNNDADHYNSFSSNDREYGRGARNGWWQPDGTGSWRLYDVDINKVCYSDGTSEVRATGTASQDKLLEKVVADAGDRAAAKLVDLDPEQQLVSQIWGLQFRVLNKSSGEVVLSGEFEPTGFFDIWWSRQQGKSGDIGASACYQSVLTDLEWGDLSGSRCLQELHELSPDILSIKFMTDSYAMSGAEQSFGRVVGTVGPATVEGPHHFVPGRQLIPQITVSGGSASPVGSINSGVCVVDENRRKVICDFGNSLPTSGSTGLNDIGQVTLGINDNDHNVFRSLGVSDYQSSQDWYETTAGIEEFPKDRPMTAEEMTAVMSNPLVVVVPNNSAEPPVFESQGGWYVRPDNFVLRLNYQETLTSKVYVTQWGRLKAGEAISCTLDNRGLQPVPGIPVGTPASGISFTNEIVSGPAGYVEFEITGGDVKGAREPSQPGKYGLDGQLYGIRCTLKSLPIGSRNNYNFRNFISVMVYGKKPDDLPPPENITWYDHVQPIFQQYSDLYPRPHGPRNYRPKYPEGQFTDSPTNQPANPQPPALNPIVDLSSYKDVSGYASFVKKAMTLPVKHPNHMPVVRDLSKWKRQMILDWLDTTGGEDGKPNEGTAPEALVASVRSGSHQSNEPSPDDMLAAELGGKTAAALKMQSATESLMAEMDHDIPVLHPDAKNA